MGLTQGLRAAFDRLVVYLPVLLMASLAFGTYWLVRMSPALLGAEPATAVRHEPDFDLQEFTLRHYDRDGKLQAEVLGLSARHFPDDDTLEVDQVRVRSWDQHGRQTIATARAGLTRSDGSRSDLRGDAQLVREAFVDSQGRTQAAWLFRSQQLQTVGSHAQVVTAQPVEVQRGADRFSAEGMRYDSAGQVLLLQGRVRALLQPHRDPRPPR